MKKFFCSTALILLAATALYAETPGSKTNINNLPSAETTWHRGPGREWEVNFNDAVAKAKETKKKVFMLATGSDWCPPCKAELPDFQAAYEQYGDEVEFLFIEVVNWGHETVADVEAFMEENGYDFPVYYDVNSDAETVCGVSSIPMSIFIGKDGKVKRTYLGMIQEFVLNNYIKEIIE